MIDLDHNAGSPLRPNARSALDRALAAGGNASSIHGRGRAARRILEDARERIAALCGTRSERVVFTSGGTEANALALHGRRTLASAVEHPAILAQPGVVAARLPVDAAGRVIIEGIAEKVRATDVDTVAVMAANNETGVIQPLAAVRAALPAETLLHVDAVQAPGRLDLARLTALADSVALSAHKSGGPPGAGALVLGDGCELLPLIAGGGQERGRRGGTENTPALSGFAVALDEACSGDEASRLARLRDGLEAALLAAVPDLVVVGAAAPRLANTMTLTARHWDAERLIIALDLAGIAASSGAACSSGKVSASHVLAAMGLDHDMQRGALRFSLGWSTTAADIEAAVARILPVLTARRAA